MKNKYLLLLMLCMAFWSCQDYLDVVPEEDIRTVESSFEKTSTARKFLLSSYNAIADHMRCTTEDPAILGGDEFYGGESVTNPSFVGGANAGFPAFKIARGLQNTLKVSIDKWAEPTMGDSKSSFYASIRYCNIYISHVDGVHDMSDQEKRQTKAEMKALKATYYYFLLRMYGPCVLVPNNIKVNENIEEMKIPRSPFNECMAEIVKLFDEAIPNMKGFKEQNPVFYGRINKEAAAMFKAKALLLAASPLFNGNPWYAGLTNRKGDKFYGPYDAKKWLLAAKACDEAIEICAASGKMLIDNTENENSKLLNTITNIKKSAHSPAFTSTEMILGEWDSSRSSDIHHFLPRYNTRHDRHFDQVAGDINPTLRMAELFYTENGLPISMDKYWNYENKYKIGIESDEKYENIVKLKSKNVNLHFKREPRFYANIAFSGGYWKRDGEYVEMQAYRGGDHENEFDRIIPGKPQNLTGYWCKKVVPEDVYATFRVNDKTNSPQVVLRLADLYLMQAEAWNEAGNAGKAFEALNKVRERAGIPTVQKSWASFSKNPSKLSSLEGRRDVIRTERLIEMSFEGSRFWDLRRWKIAHIHQNKPIMGWNTFSDQDGFYNNGSGPILISKEFKFQSPRDYLFPISQAEIITSEVKQNFNW